VDVFVTPELGDAFDELVPALERLARARPLRRHASRDELHGSIRERGLAVIVGDTEAIVGPGEDTRDTTIGDRARLEKELAEAERLLDAARARLANGAFVSKAPAAIVEGARARETELAEQVARLRDRLSG
ncbi:MAG: hypothetical protein ACJ77N_03495, partial [Chloroflexota bacterium]